MTYSQSEHWEFEKRLISLALSDQSDEAGKLIEQARSEALETADNEHLEQVLSLGMHIYCIMNPPRIADAERFAAEAEQIDRSGYRKLQTAQMKYWSTQDLQGAITKAQESIDLSQAEGDEKTTYTAFAILGAALLDEGRVDEANQALDSIIAMIDERRRIVVGDETFFLEKMFAAGHGRDRIQRVASILTPYCREEAFTNRLQKLTVSEIRKA